ncbi:nuclear transport factor 2 family protein [Tomitella biformata]|uniref:nuclear transport factor 2 family protein n=1 Tax=Tomitella biformata TaxID=630403 RepID=UPI0004667E58|nr:nuclear transport factor 2 family protein [Tomitella biformata]
MNAEAQLQELWDVESIKRMRASVSRLLDTKRWEEFGDRFTADAVLEAPEAGLRCVSRTEIVKLVSAGMDGVRSVHHLHAPEITITGPDSATGIWAMSDSLERASAQGPTVMTGYGHYVERYERHDGDWRVQLLRLERLRIDN